MLDVLSCACGERVPRSRISLHCGASLLILPRASQYVSRSNTWPTRPLETARTSSTVDSLLFWLLISSSNHDAPHTTMGAPVTSRTFYTKRELCSTRFGPTRPNSNLGPFLTKCQKTLICERNSGLCRASDRPSGTNPSLPQNCHFGGEGRPKLVSTKASRLINPSVRDLLHLHLVFLRAHFLCSCLIDHFSFSFHGGVLVTPPQIRDTRFPF